MRRHGITGSSVYTSTLQASTRTHGRANNWSQGERVWWARVLEEDVRGGKSVEEKADKEKEGDSEGCGDCEDELRR
ncbi:Protein of unknown function [Pyronema omphalodes CBS 100304]|uniref:Uncharacterized protein n=1 Tax=Pyronema omphalodes (strain CBS 100304) TaxID=1076935 RepID=U4LXF4_PYROM|nr:Protein of unknown function [Pyronema omphalodes CBS 100304]